MTATKDEIISLLHAFMEQRPGMEFANYGDVRSYRSESRSITRDLHDARTLLRAVSWRESITAENLAAAFRAFSGRLTLTERKGRPALDYCTGQYFPTEYRKAVCAVLASALWDYYRDECMPAPIGTMQSRGYETEAYPTPGKRGEVCSAGDWLRTTFKCEFGAHLARRYFD
jgi:hypothetical protein